MSVCVERESEKERDECVCVKREEERDEYVCLCLCGVRERKSQRIRKSGENDGRDERDEKEIVMLRKT